MDTMDFKVTDQASLHVQYLLDNKKKKYMRLRVISGGCSGFRYEFSLEDERHEEDIIINDIIIDQLSITFLDSAILDYVMELGNEEFVIKNPNATASCGCGNSFSI